MYWCCPQHFKFDHFKSLFHREREGNGQKWNTRGACKTCKIHYCAHWICRFVPSAWPSPSSLCELPISRCQQTNHMRLAKFGTPVQMQQHFQTRSLAGLILWSVSQTTMFLFFCISDWLTFIVFVLLVITFLICFWFRLLHNCLYSDNIIIIILIILLLSILNQ